jgi:hypothetical protein
MADRIANTGVSAQEVEGLNRFSWENIPTVFSVAREAGFNTSAIGWYLPYCRMFNTVLTDCAWWPMPTQATSMGETYLGKVYGELRSLFESDTMSPFGQSLAIQQKTGVYKAFLQRSEAAVSDPGYGFVFLHVPVPHAPHSYNRFSGKFDERNNPIQGYIDSLALMDRMLGTLRLDMERAGLWDSTVIILTADHPCRISGMIDGKSDPRIPYLIRFPHDSTPAQYGRQLRSVLTSGFVLSVLRGEVPGRQQAIDWFERHRNDLDMPVGEAPSTFMQ